MPALAALGAAVAVWLIVSGGPDGAEDDRDAGDGDTSATLDLSDTSQAGVETLTGLEFPEGTNGFLTARLEDDSQLDITALIPAEQESAFLAASGLEQPEAGRAVITHSSPLWELEPGGTVRGVSDRHEDLLRRVELLDEEGAVRVRAVVTPAAD